VSDRDVWAVVPAKDFRRGKSRLGGVLEDDVRTAFARGLFLHVTSELAAAEPIAGVLVLTDDDAVERTALRAGHAVRRDQDATTLREIVDRGLADVQARGARAAVVCMADLPNLRREEIAQAVAALDDADVVVVPDLERAGTNVLCLSPPTRLATCFGNEDSFMRHVRAAHEAQARVRTLELSSLCFDVDGPDDLETLAKR